MTERRGVTRRGFLKSVGAAAATGGAALPGLALAVRANEALAEDGPEVLGPGPVPVTLHVNGKKHALKIDPRVTLLDALRNEIGLTGPKEVCDGGACGACTVLLDGVPVNSCSMLAIDAASDAGATHAVTTAEGLCVADGAPNDLQRAFTEKDALQCGYCTCGMVVASEALLRSNPSPSADDVRAGISGNICRCGTYPRIVEAVLSTASLRRKAK